MRQGYQGDGLDVTDFAAEPFTQFTRWFADAVRAGLAEPNAMVLATASADGQPSARTVLLKGYDERGFVFFTNYGSRKAREAAENPRASLVFPWHEIGRQIVVTGSVEWLGREDSEEYFRTRPRDSQLGAWASQQSATIISRAELEQHYLELSARYPEGTPVPLPEFWGGLRVVPQVVEFWMGRASRLHDRLRYRRRSTIWMVDQLAP